MGVVTSINATKGSFIKASNGFIPGTFPGNDGVLDDLLTERDTTTISKREQKPYSQVIRGVIAPKGFDTLDEAILFQFNPSSIVDSKSTDWQSSALMGFAHAEYVWMNGGARNISFQLHLEATSDVNNRLMGKLVNYGDDTIDTLPQNFPEGTTPMVNGLRSFLYPVQKNKKLVSFVGSNPSPQDRFTHPPVLIFSFGSYYVECLLTMAEFTHTLFNSDLKPVRTTVAVTLAVLEGYTLNRDKRLIQ